MLKASFIILVLCVCGLTAQAQAKWKVKQERVVDFPSLGQLRLQVLEAGDSYRVSFKAATDGKPVRVFSSTKSRSRLRWPIFKAAHNEALYFKVGKLAGVPGPLIFISRVFRGADHCDFKTVVVGEVVGRLRVLVRKPFKTDDMGGMFVGDFGGQSVEGVSLWSFIWANDESHLGAHRYRFELYKYDQRQSLFVKTKVLSSRKKYEQGEEAAKELHLPSQNFLFACDDLFKDGDASDINRENR